MSNYNISLLDKYGKYNHHSVDYEIYTYIKQLEGYINNPDKSNLKEVYKNRFKSDPQASQ